MFTEFLGRVPRIEIFRIFFSISEEPFFSALPNGFV